MTTTKFINKKIIIKKAWDTKCVYVFWRIDRYLLIQLHFLHIPHFEGFDFQYFLAQHFKYLQIHLDFLLGIWAVFWSMTVFISLSTDLFQTSAWRLVLLLFGLLRMLNSSILLFLDAIPKKLWFALLINSLFVILSLMFIKIFLRHLFVNTSSLPDITLGTVYVGYHVEVLFSFLFQIRFVFLRYTYQFGKCFFCSPSVTSSSLPTVFDITFT